MEGTFFSTLIFNYLHYFKQEPRQIFNKNVSLLIKIAVSHRSKQWKKSVFIKKNTGGLKKKFPSSQIMKLHILKHIFNE